MGKMGGFEKEYLSTGEAAKLSGVPARTLRQRAEAGKMRVLKRWGKGTHYRYLRIDIEEIKKSGYAPYQYSNKQLTPLEEIDKQPIPPESGMILTIPLKTDDIWIDSIIITPSDLIPFTFYVWYREQQEDSDQLAIELALKLESNGSILVHKPLTAQFYTDMDKTKKLHYAISVEKRPMKFNLSEQDLQKYLVKPVDFTIALRYWPSE